MCLILLAYDAHPDFRLIIAANRDEYFARPSAPAMFWDDAPALLAGRDLEHGGTWLGITRGGRFAALTNFRGAPSVSNPRSRGSIATAFLLGDLEPARFIASLERDAHRYQGFSLLAGDRRALCYYTNQHAGNAPLGDVPPGVHGLSNHLLDTPWPKVARGTRALERSLPLAPRLRERALLEALRDRVPPSDEALPVNGAAPATAAPLAFERELAAPFIHAPERDYGTRCSTLLSIGRDGEVEFGEWTWDRQGQPAGAVRHHFSIAAGVGSDGLRFSA